MGEPLGLRATQRWVQGVITHPHGVLGGVAAQRAGPGAARVAGDVVAASSRRLSPEQRLAIYASDYSRRLLECMQAMYPVLRHALGDELFDAFTLDYLASHPSTGPSLFDLPREFERHLADTRPPDEAWPDFIIDLARLERTFSDVFDGPGSEGAAAASPDTGAAPADHAARRLVASPALRLLEFRYPVVEYFHEVRRQDDPPLPGPARSWAAVHRRNYVVMMTELTREEFALLCAITSGTPDAVSLARPPEPSWIEARIEAWTEQGILVEQRQIEPPPSPPSPSPPSPSPPSPSPPSPSSVTVNASALAGPARGAHP